MSLHTNSDYEIISDAEISSVISKYSPGMIDMVLNDILKYKINNHMTPLGNMVSSYETNFKIDMQNYPQVGAQMSELRINIYNSIMDKICKAHELSYQLPSNADIYTSAYFMYQFLVSGFYQGAITFFVNFLTKECDEIYKMFNTKNEDINPTHQYAKKRYNGKPSLAFIHTNLNKVIDNMYGFDISLQDIINTVFTGNQTEIASYLCSIFVDNGNFFKNFYYPAVSGINRAEATTNIRLKIMPMNIQIGEYVEEDN